MLLPIADYIAHYQTLPFGLRARLEERWGAPESVPFFDPKEGGFKRSILGLGNGTLGLQPARGYNIDPVETYHSPELIPPHNYLAVYFWIRHHQKAQAIVHMGKHGNLEWLPGKGVALSESCYPDLILGPMPHF